MSESTPRLEPTTHVTASFVHEERLLFEQSKPGCRGIEFPPLGVPAVDARSLLGKMFRAQLAELPEVSEPQVVRHFVRLSQWNYSIEIGPYPLGSCTMKYNPKVNEVLANLPGFARQHPFMPEQWTQGSLKLMKELEKQLCAISGLAACTLQPAAGAHGEFTGLMVMRKWQESRGQGHRNKVLVPDSAHGTNPASAALAGCESIELKSNAQGLLDADEVRRAMGGDCVGLMVTNPNTLGLFEAQIAEVCAIVHERGGLVYMDGANMNAIQGKVLPGAMGIDAMHFNLHKTYSTPHGGGGPGAGPICVRADLAPFLPVPHIVEHDDGTYSLDYDQPQSVGKMKGFFGNFLILVRAYAYLRAIGAEGIARNAELAVLNANYIMAKLRGVYSPVHDVPCMHEAVFCDKSFKDNVKTLDVCKRLMDYGYHPPTMYFPLNVSGSIMIEPTENEPKEALDEFIEAMLAIHAEAKSEPKTLTSSPHRTFRKRVDETTANRKPVLRWRREVL
ncbi:MAG: glycine dehydrogenase (aminomethyl-transferring) [Deltaproteobacteria bacterium CG2_30_63_29]|nr:MAG: glycine dehydrogenase (aminomethyl-transferring) [Deltaproteobacteria bacterium CG2_30_63_29]PIV99081.1 MAG: glycine dehydrogenase (aminomethyl-transferring) [Deltaproteobacteria bacterium CG17_big_fil_post_rev_8_21_14_2_50_63_7]PJB43973.1 MAG: glycine dehydrogenase (aminomethyl-transferring) [Deltaproteobacteria bacterium CG_4_9_14_3_um_filter_63_12]